MPILLPFRSRYKDRPVFTKIKIDCPGPQKTLTRPILDKQIISDFAVKYGKHTGDCQTDPSIKQQRSWWQTALDSLLPPRCILCGQTSGPECICAPCKSELPWIGIHCHQCGLPLGSDKDKVCGQCIQNQPPFSRTLCPLHYEFPVDRLVQLFKFDCQLVCGRVLSQIIYESAALLQNDLPDVLIPVPLHGLRLIRRGFNQAYELGSDISKALDIPLVAASLRRRRNTKAQSGLSRS